MFFLQQWFSNIPLKETKCRPTILLEPHKKFYHESIDWFCFIALTKSVTQNIRCYWKTLSIERNPSPAKNQTLSSCRVYISPTK